MAFTGPFVRPAAHDQALAPAMPSHDACSLREAHSVSKSRSALGTAVRAGACGGRLEGKARNARQRGLDGHRVRTSARAQNV